MRLTFDNITAATSYYNPLYERTIDLRGMKIPAIENMGALKDGFDCIDLSDNSVKKLGGFPKLSRVKTLLLSSNRICRIAPNLSDQLPNLQTLNLANNSLDDFAELDGLIGCPITRLILVDNKVKSKPDYRLYCIHILPRLKMLDFTKVKPQERKESLAKFGKLDAKEKKEKAKTFMPGEVVGAIPAEVVGGTTKRTVDPAKAAAVRSLLQRATTVNELTKIETALQSDNDADLDILLAEYGLGPAPAPKPKEKEEKKKEEEEEEEEEEETKMPVVLGPDLRFMAKDTADEPDDEDVDDD